jgi:hypothetical protein
MEQLKAYIKSTPLADIFIYIKSIFVSPASQSDEAAIIDRLIRRFDIPHSFIEFGFSGWEFNCATLIGSWRGVLADASSYNVRIGKILCGDNVEILQIWLTLESIQVIIDRFRAMNCPLGILSVDVDGNDYWFLKKLLELKPSIVIAEYNSSFGLRPVTVPYDPSFDRTVKHETHTYYGASLTALHALLSKNNYSLLEISNSGVNAFFVRNDLLSLDEIALRPEFCFREKVFRDGSRPSQQWAKIEHLPFVNVADA